MGKPLDDEPPNRLRELREARELTLEEVAERADTSFQQIHRLETRERRMTLHWMHRLAAALDCEPTELMVTLADGQNPTEMTPEPPAQNPINKAHHLGSIVRQLIELDQVSIRRIREYLAAQPKGPPELGLYEDQAEVLRKQLRAVLDGGNDD